MLYMDRREFLAALAAAGVFSHESLAASSFSVRFRKPSPYAAYIPLIRPDADAYSCEREARVVESHLNALLQRHSLPLAPGFRGISPLPVRYVPVAEHTSEAQFDAANTEFEAGLRSWIESLGTVRRASFFALPDHRVRYEVASAGQYRVGFWRQVWKDGMLAEFAPIEEILVQRSEPLFRDVTAHAFRDTASFHEQLLGGNTWWRSKLDAACGIDVYAHNGIAAGDIDNDGRDEIYVCQQGGLPNRLYKAGRDGAFSDITGSAGVGVLDDTTSALFLDVRNSGLQDLVVLCAAGPLLFLNNGDSTFRHVPNAFRFATTPQGSFTGMAAADYDRDGRLDLYICSYVYFQSEDQYRFPVPYHDAQNGPPNYLFRNRLDSEDGCFEDVTDSVGLNHNNNRYSFAPAWCDYDGDGWPDLYVANDFGRSNLYRNHGGKFRDEAPESGAENVGPAMSASWFDYDGDGRPDLCVSNMWTAPGQRIIADPAFVPAQKSAKAYWGHTMGNALFHNQRDGSFQDTASQQGVSMGRWAWSSDAFDFDNDGSPEIYVTCGMLTNPSPQDLNGFFWRQVVAHSPADARPAPEYEAGWNAINQFIREDYSWSGREPNVFYVRPKATAGREPRYFDFSGVSGIDFAEDSRAFSVLDWDGDGNLDIVLKSRLAPQVRVLRNEAGAGKPVIVLNLRGVKSNRDAVGTRVEVNGRTQFVTAGSGYLSQHTKNLHFALNTGHAAEVRIVWPSGLTQTLAALPAGFRHEVEEGSDQVLSVPLLKRADLPSAGGALLARNEPELGAAWLLEPVRLPDERSGPGFVLLHGGENPMANSSLPITAIDLTRAADEIAATYSIWRRYLFEYRVDLTPPLLLLIDGLNRAHKIYFAIPPQEVLAADLKLLQAPERDRLALPFAGKYYRRPRRSHMKLGAALYWAGYPDQALPYFADAAKRDSDNWKAVQAIAQIHFEGSRYEQAREGFESALKIHPGLPSALLGAGQSYAKLGQLPEAEQMLVRLLELDATHADAANQLGLVYARQNREADAKRLFKRAIQSRKDHTPAINNLGVLYMKLGQPKDAIATFRYGVEVAPADSSVAINLARACLAVGDGEQARETLVRFLDRKPGDPDATRALRELGNR